MQKHILLSSTLVGAFLAMGMPAQAQDATDRNNGELVVVTANRMPQPISRTGSAISVFSGARIEQQQIVSVSDALEQMPGVSLVRNGGPGQTTSLSLRGADAGESVLLIDGVRLNDVSSVDNQPILADVLANNIDRIELLRGPQSTLYGSDAIGGVANILTRRGGGAPFAGTLSAEGGMLDTYRLNGAAHGTVSGIEYGGAVNYYSTGGVSAADARKGNTERDGYRNFGATANVHAPVIENVSIDLRGYYTRSRTDFDGFASTPPYAFGDTRENGKSELLAGYGGVNVDLFGGRLHNRVAVVATQSQRDNYDPASLPTHTFKATGRATRFEYQGTAQIVEGLLDATFGAETQRSDINTASAFSVVATRGGRDTAGYYAEAHLTPIEQLSLTGGVRLEDDSRYGQHTTLKFAGAYTFADWGATLRASYGDGFKAPTLYQLYSEYSNPVANLNAETARGWDAGFDKMLLNGTVRASLTYFERRTKNKVDFFSCFGVTSAACTARAAQGGYYYNVGRARATGFEAELAARLGSQVSLTASYSNITSVNLISGLPLPRRPHNSASLTLDWHPEAAWSAGASLVYVGPRFDDAFATTRLGENITLNVFGDYRVDANWQLYARVENLLDERVEPVAGYGRTERAVYAGVRFTQ